VRGFVELGVGGLLADVLEEGAEVVEREGRHWGGSDGVVK
jgi:hypothetical protein